MRKIFTGISILSLVVCITMTSKPAHSQVNDTANYPYWIEMMQNPEVNFFQTVKAFETYWKDREITKGSGYKPFKRWQYWTGRLVSPTGVIPSAGSTMEAYNRFLADRSNESRDLEGDWTSLGPHSVPSGYNGYRGIGRISAIAFHPTDPQTIYIGAPAGGLWRTIDHGANWVVLTDSLPTLGVSAIIVDAVDPNLIFIGTGDRDAGDAPGLGVWKSTNAGLTWQQWNNGMGNAIVGRMIQDPFDNNIILAATSVGIYRSVDAGQTWVRSITGNYKEIVFKPSDNNIVYAVSGGNFYRSMDNGASFENIDDGLPGGSRAVVGVTAADPEMVYFFLTNGDSFKGLYRSTDGGTSFTVRSTTPNIMSWDCDGGSGGQAWYDLDMAVEPENAEVIYGGGVNCFKSTDGGLTWAIRSHWYGGCGVQSVHADLHILEYNPLNNRLFAGNDGGVYWSENSGVNWTEISNGLTISQAYKIGQSLTEREFVINGYQDNGSSTYIGTDWVSVGGGDGMECAFDPKDSRYSYSTIYYGSIDRQFNHNNQGGIAGNGVNGITESGGWVTPFVLDHNDGNIMFIGYKNIWRSTNVKAGSTNSVDWTKISTMSSSDMNVLAQSRANTDILYASSGNRLYRSDNVKAASVEWTTLTSNLPSNNSITSIETSPFDENTVYIAMQTSIYKSIDKGLTWTNISANMSGLQINSVAYYKNSNEGLYLGTEVGVFYKDSSLENWILYAHGLPASTRVTEIEIYYDSLNAQNDAIRAGTYGRGLWSSPPYFSALEANFQASATTLSAGCSIDFTDLTAGTPMEWYWSFNGASPSTSNLQNPQNITYPGPGTYNVTLTVSNPLNSDTELREGYITVTEASAPQVMFSASDTVGCSGMTVIFHDESGNCPSSWLWQFDPPTVSFVDWTSATSANPHVRFNETGSYTVSLTAGNTTGSNIITLENYIQTGGYSIPFTESFEGASLEASGWTVENPDESRTWQIASEEGYAWMYLYNYSGIDQRDYLVSPALNLSGFEQIYLNFSYAYAQRATQKDSLIVSVSEDCGVNWQRVYANGPDGNGIFETAEPTMSYFTPATEDDWCGAGFGADCPTIDLSAYAGKANVKLRFETFNNYGNNLYIRDITVSNITNVDETALIDGVSVYPNPANEYVHINLDSKWLGSDLMLTDSRGKIVMQKKITSLSTKLNLKNLTSGVYMIVLNGSETVKQKFVIR